MKKKKKETYHFWILKDDEQRNQKNFHPCKALNFIQKFPENNTGGIYSFKTTQVALAWPYCYKSYNAAENAFVRDLKVLEVISMYLGDRRWLPLINPLKLTLILIKYIPETKTSLSKGK